MQLTRTSLERARHVEAGEALCHLGLHRWGNQLQARLLLAENLSASTPCRHPPER